MKTVAIVSAVTFVLIFGGVGFMTQKLQTTGDPAVVEPELVPEDHAAAERMFEDLAVERDRLQRDKEKLIVLQQQLAVQEKLVATAQANLTEVINRLQAEQKVYTAEKEKSARKLAKMYEAMKPAKAAPILSGLEMEIILEIIGRMQEKSAAKVLSFMDAGLAARISAEMSLKGAG